MLLRWYWGRAPIQYSVVVTACGFGVAALASGMPFLTNLFGYGRTGTLASAGSIGILNAAAGLAVTVAMLLLFAEFLETYVVPLEPEDAAS